jgi:hypothetical protein
LENIVPSSTNSHTIDTWTATLSATARATVAQETRAPWWTDVQNLNVPLRDARGRFMDEYTPVGRITLRSTSPSMAMRLLTIPQHLHQLLARGWVYSWADWRGIRPYPRSARDSIWITGMFSHTDRTNPLTWVPLCSICGDPIGRYADTDLDGNEWSCHQECLRAEYGDDDYGDDGSDEYDMYHIEPEDDRERSSSMGAHRYSPWSDMSAQEALDPGHEGSNGHYDPYDEWQREDIHDWDFRPRPTFYTGLQTGGGYLRSHVCPKAITLGFELEIHHNERSNLAGRIGKTRLADFSYMKRDGSITGVELVSMPGTLEFFHAANWDGFADIIDAGGRCWGHGTCGLHIHIGRQSFVDPVTGRPIRSKFMAWYRFMHRNANNWIKLAGRHSTDYAPWALSEADRASRRTFAWAPLKGKIAAVPSSRYSAINVQPRATVEMRFWRPSLRPATHLAALEATHASVVYATSELSLKNINNGAKDWSVFTEWAFERPEYSNMKLRCQERGVA